MFVLHLRKFALFIFVLEKVCLSERFWLNFLLFYSLQNLKPLNLFPIFENVLKIYKKISLIVVLWLYIVIRPLMQNFNMQGKPFPWLQENIEIASKGRRVSSVSFYYCFCCYCYYCFCWEFTCLNSELRHVILSFSSTSLSTYREHKRACQQYRKMRENLFSVFDDWIRKPQEHEEFCWIS